MLRYAIYDKCITIVQNGGKLSAINIDQKIKISADAIEPCCLQNYYEMLVFSLCIHALNSAVC